jgi:transcription elongation factor S-II
MYNIKHNSEFRDQIAQNQITPLQLTHLTHQEIAPLHWKDKIEMKIKRDRSRFSTNIEASTDMFQCRKCKSKKCTYYEMQTRSADEPSNIFITCLDCGKNWKN